MLNISDWLHWVMKKRFTYGAVVCQSEQVPLKATRDGIEKIDEI